MMCRSTQHPRQSETSERVALSIRERSLSFPPETPVIHELASYVDVTTQVNNALFFSEHLCGSISASLHV